MVLHVLKFDESHIASLAGERFDIWRGMAQDVATKLRGGSKTVVTNPENNYIFKFLESNFKNELRSLIFK